MASSNVKTVGVISTGVIGSSWIALFLARGLRVLIASSRPDSEEKLATYLDSAWPTLESMGLPPNADRTNYKFVGTSLEGYYDQVDFVQEVGCPEEPPQV